MSLSGSVNVGATAGFGVGSFTEYTGGIGRGNEDVEGVVVVEDEIGVGGALLCGGISGCVASN